MKKLYVLALIFAAPNLFADPISVDRPCFESGNRVLTGDFNSETGAFDLKTVLKDCKKFNNNTVNGTILTQGTFIAGDGSVAKLDATIKTDLVIEHHKRRGRHHGGPDNFLDLVGEKKTKITKRKCTKVIQGDYVTDSQIFNGKVEETCQREGKTYMPLVDMILGLSDQVNIDNGDFYPEDDGFDEEPIPVEGDGGIGDGGEPLPEEDDS